MEGGKKNIILSAFFTVITLTAYSQKVDNNYILMPITQDAFSIFYYYRGDWSYEPLPAYFIVNENNLIEFCEKNKVDYNKMGIICDNKNGLYYIDTIAKKYRLRYMSGIGDILKIDDTEVIKIDTQFVVIKNIEYSYLDSINVACRADIYKDDFCEGEEDVMIDVSDYFRKMIKYRCDVTEYRYFLYMKRQLPTHKKIHKKKICYAYELELNSEKPLFRITPYDYLYKNNK